ncbi:putative cytochrome P450 oxidoreductase [Lophium mytilinum]|uniref:Putative cytochrome P450 oxidoreductase n=1 Tax=Lophium mytilinum TaxID=390894 RepID=A0A6A6RAK8_9PEZI|nr:putative cytochrome P450 oxidoreductase [Lophium mytilinum]
MALKNAMASFHHTMGETPWVKAGLVVLVLYSIYRILQIGKRDKRMPPGPPTIPLLGNLHQIPITGLYKKMRDWGEKYGGIYSLKFASSNVIVLYDRKAIHELVDKRGLLYAERPHSYVTNLVTHGDSLIWQDHHEKQKVKRKITTHNFSPLILDEKVAPVQDAEVTVLLNDLLERPRDIYYHMRRLTSSIATILVFGQRATTYEDFWGHCVYDALDRFGEALEPGANPPVDEFPFLKYIPLFLAPWKRRAIYAGDVMNKIWAEARKRVDDRRARGDIRTSLGSLADKLLDEYAEKGTNLGKDELDHFFGLLVEGGAETTSSTMLTLVLCLALNPRVQIKARKELDAVCGSERMPEWSDFARLPYINSIIKEGMRWRPAVPLGIPHRVAADDYYEGMLIPKDSTIFMPTWALQHAEHLGYDEPYAFKPESIDWPGYSGRLADGFAHHYGYGTGRRMCPGIHLAERTQWRIAAKLLWAFEILPGVDKTTGKPVNLDPNAYVEGLLHGPAPFEVIFKPRSQAHVDVITRELASARKFLEPYE